MLFMTILNKSFFCRPTLDVAQELIGKELFFFNQKGIITETEAYIGQDDPACHAARGQTKRNAVMFEEGGFSYVYLIYGMYYCLNFVTEAKGFPAAVLIRGIYIPETKLDLNGPGKLCKNLGITKEHNAIDLTKNKNFFVNNTELVLNYKATPRIGIKAGLDKLWRFAAVDYKN